MKTWLIGAVIAAISVSLSPVVDAKRLGGGKSQGMQRSAPAQAAPQTPPKPATPQQAAPQQASPQPAAPAAAAAPAKRSWLGPIAGLAAGLGLAALMSHLGLGEAFANFLMLALLAVGAALLVAFLIRRFGRGSAGAQTAGPTLATAGASAGQGAVLAPPGRDPVRLEPSMHRSPIDRSEVSVTGQPLRPIGVPGAEAQAPVAEASVAAQSSEPALQAAAGPRLPEGFDLPAFERVAKLIFIRLQAANDKADLDDLRQFTTPELFASIRLDLQDRHGAAQHTDVERVEASVIDYALEGGRQIVSVRFQGMIREQADALAEAFDEVWHLVKPEGDGGQWAIAGIQQPQ